LGIALGDKNTTIRRLRKMLFGARTEKTAAVVGDRKDSPPPPAQDVPSALGYLAPADKLAGREAEIFATRDRELAEARGRRKEQA
jgi:hypothetical protein